MNKSKVAPYDLRPGPAPRIEVDLTYFLVEQNVEEKIKKGQDIQTDELLPRPPSPPYQPLKTGIDNSTQIWDTDLFNYDRDVEPILEVLCTKVMEQAKLEVEEETEMANIKRTQDDFKTRERMESNEWEREVKEELKKVADKNDKLKKARELKKKRETINAKIMSLWGAKHYLSKLYTNSANVIHQAGLWNNNQREFEQDRIFTDLIDIAKTKQDIQGDYHAILGSLINESVGTHVAPYSESANKYKQSLAKKRALREINDPKIRKVRILFTNITKPATTQFMIRFPKKLQNKLKEFDDELSAKFAQIETKFKEGDDVEEDIMQYNQKMSVPYDLLQMDANNYRSIAISVSTDPFYKQSDANKIYAVEVIYIGEKGNVISKILKNSDKGAEYDNNLWDNKLNDNDDERIVITLKKVPILVRTILLGIRQLGVYDEGTCANARYRIYDAETNQNIDTDTLKKVRESRYIHPEDAAATDDKKPSQYYYFCGRLFKNKNWEYESVNIASIDDANLDKVLTDTAQLMADNSCKPIDFKEWQDDAKAKAAAADLSKNKINTSKLNTSISKKDPKKDSKKKDDKKKDEKKKEDKKLFTKDNKNNVSKNSVDSRDEDSKEKDEPKFEDIVKKHLWQTFGPVEIDCTSDASQIESSIFNQIKKENSELYHDCTNGLEIQLGNKLLVNGKQILSNGKNIQLFTVHPKMPKILNIETSEVKPTDEVPKDDN
jgi:hypothetical protein